MSNSVWLNLRKLVAPPVFEGDEEKTRKAAFLNVLLWAAMGTQLLSPILYSGRAERGAVCAAAWILTFLGCLVLLRRGSVRAASIAAIIASWVLVNLMSATAGGIRANGFSGCLIVAGCAGMLLSWRAMVVTIVASILSGLGMMLLEQYGVIHPEPTSMLSEWATYVVVFFVAALQLGLFITDIRRALDRARTELAERSRTEQALMESEERYRTLIESAPEAILVLDLDTGKFADFNKNAEVLLGRTREELLTLGPADITFPLQPGGKDTQEQIRLRIQETLDKGVSSFEWLFRHQSGREVYCEAHVVRLPSRTRRLLRGTIIDITARKRLEASLLQAQKMESIGLLAGGVAHDFNNLLAVILSSTELMALKPECAPAKPHVNDIRSAASRATQLTRQLLAFSRKQILQPTVLDLNAVIIETEKMLRRLIGAHIDMRLDLAPDAYSVLVDRGQFEQVLLNLVVNARDAMPKGGTLTVLTRNSSNGNNSHSTGDTPAPVGPFLVLEVSDTGCGMDERTKAHIFEPFFTTKDVGQGTGLGLSTVHGIVKQSGGHITVESSVGQGTTFRIYLPRCDQSQSRRAATPVEKFPTRGSETILLAEDNDLALNVAARSLEAFGYKVLKAECPETAIELARTYDGKIDLLLTDVIMPKMNGRQLAREVKISRPGIRTLFTSGYARDVIVHQGVLEEGIELLEKPFTPEGLARRVRSVLDVGRETKK